MCRQFFPQHWQAETRHAVAQKLDPDPFSSYEPAQLMQTGGGGYTFEVGGFVKAADPLSCHE
jgi:hypothetical protein